jgi:hypothetical protein
MSSLVYTFAAKTDRGYAAAGSVYQYSRELCASGQAVGRILR